MPFWQKIFTGFQWHFSEKKIDMWMEEQAL